MNLSSEKLDRQGLFLLENSCEIFLWIGKAVPAHLITSLFGVSSANELPSGKITLPRLDNDINARMQNLIEHIRKVRMTQATVYPHLYLVRDEGDPNLRLWFLSHLVEDRMDNNLSYPQFLAQTREELCKVNN